MGLRLIDRAYDLGHTFSPDVLALGDSKAGGVHVGVMDTDTDNRSKSI